MATFSVNGFLIERNNEPAPKLTPRVCVICKKPKGTMAHTVQADDGSMRSIFVHLPCIRKLLKEKV